VLGRGDAIASFERVVKGLALETMTQNDDISGIMLARFCDDIRFTQGNNLVLNQVDFGVLETLEIFDSEYKPLASRCILS
jgi:hypothetical protein